MAAQLQEARMAVARVGELLEQADGQLEVILRSDLQAVDCDE
ncbi:hypothetical protein [Ornithinimicrobium cryptoxanthini]|nr:hypothetical protein [Ornithinimicrobium cryptoxanthini]